jgi:hypothetical protein
MDRILKVNYLIDDKSYTRTYLTVMDTLEEAKQSLTDLLKVQIPDAIIYEITE